MGPPHLPGLLGWDRAPGQDSAVGGRWLALASCRHPSPSPGKAKLDVIGITRVDANLSGDSTANQGDQGACRACRACFRCVTAATRNVEITGKSADPPRGPADFRSGSGAYLLAVVLGWVLGWVLATLGLAITDFQVSGPTTPSTSFRCLVFW